MHAGAVNRKTSIRRRREGRRIRSNSASILKRESSAKPCAKKEQEKGPACAGPSLFLGRKHPTEDPMNVPQAVPLVVAEMSHLQRKAPRGKTPAVPSNLVNQGNLLMKTKVMA
jgi:hypothetical protein